MASKRKTDPEEIIWTKNPKLESSVGPQTEQSREHLEKMLKMCEDLQKMANANNNKGPNIDSFWDDKIRELKLKLQEKLSKREAMEHKWTDIQQQIEKIQNDIEKNQKEVKLNVGGEIFIVNVEHLLKKDPGSYFSLLLCKGKEWKSNPNEDGSYFIDRDPTYFKYILNYVSDQQPFLPNERLAQLELLKEAKFYGLSGLAAEIEGADKIIREVQLGKDNIEMKQAEDVARQEYMKHAKSGTMDSYHHLINVFANASSFVIESPSSSPSIPLILDKNRFEHVQPGKPSIVPSIDEFKKKFFEIAPRLKNINWNNIFVAGGSVVGCLVSGMDKIGFSTSDIDLFIYGLNEEQANKKITEILEATKEKNAFCDPLLVRTARTLTIVYGAPQRHVQIILRLYRTPAEVLLGFDLDCVAVGFNGTDVFCLPRARRAFNYRYNIADPSRQTFRTTSYEYRLWKYSKRGFAVAIPGFARNRVNPEIYKHTFQELTGLGKLLILEARDAQRLLNIGEQRFWMYEHSFESLTQGREFRNPKETKKYQEIFDAKILDHVIDYNEKVLLPYNSTIDIPQIQQKLFTRLGDEVRASGFAEMHYTFGETFESICDTNCFVDYLDENEMNHYGAQNNIIWKIPRKLTFIGSLMEYIETLPDVEDDWFRDAYKPLHP